MACVFISCRLFYGAMTASLAWVANRDAQERFAA
jgi:hypothetical protein